MGISGTRSSTPAPGTGHTCPGRAQGKSPLQGEAGPGPQDLRLLSRMPPAAPCICSSLCPINSAWGAWQMLCKLLLGKEPRGPMGTLQSELNGSEGVQEAP